MENHDRDDFFDLPTPAPAPAAQPAQGQTGGTKKTVRVVALVLGILLAVTGAFLGGWYGQYYSLDEEVRNYLWAKSVLENNYYQPIEEGELYEYLYASLSIDPYTRYYPPQEYSDYLAEGAGENVGIGVSFLNSASEEETAQIFSIVENSPACRVGLRKGMYILAFGETEDTLSEGTYGDFAQFLPAQKGEFVLRCGFEQDGSDAQNYTLKRVSYQASFLHYRDSETSFRFQGDGSTLSLTETHEPLVGLDEKTAYIRLDEFSGNNTPVEFVSLLERMKERGRTDLVLDLRSNGGGYLSILGDIASHLMRTAKEKNPPVIVTTSRSGQVTTYICARNDFGNYFNSDSKVYVLADEYTASASECLIGALVDYGTCAFSDIFLRENENGVAKTYGKGIMQSSFTAANGAAMKLTVATVNWPVSGKCIHGVGVIPQDGAIPVPGPLSWGAKDVMLEAVLAKICG